MTGTTNNADAANADSQPRFDIDIEIDTTKVGGGDGFVTAAEANGPVVVKRATFVAKMPYVYDLGTLVKRLATMILPRSKHIAILPHTVSSYDKIVDHEAVPTDAAGIANYVFDAREWVMHRGSKTEHKMVEFKFQVESPMSVHQIKQAPQVFALLKKHRIYLFGKRFIPAVSTSPAGILLNQDPRKCSQTHLIGGFLHRVAAELNIKPFIDLVPHRASVRTGTKVVWGDFLKVMVESKHATAVAKVIQKDLREKKFNERLDNVRLMPMHPMRNMMSPETFRNMIMTHNKTMYDLVEIQVNNVWEIDDEIELNWFIKKQLGMGIFDDNDDFTPDGHKYSFKDCVMKVFTDQWKGTKVTDAYTQRGRLHIVCSKSVIDEAALVTDAFLNFMKRNFDEGSEAEGHESAAKFAEWVGCNNPENENRHPARSGTLVYGEERILKATVNSFMDSNLKSLVEGVIPVAGMAAVKPDLTRPPRAAMMSRSRRVVHVDPNEFHPTAVAAWTTANSWAAAVAPRAKAASQKKSQKKQTPKEIVTTIGDGTVSTGMSATTQAAIDKMNVTIAAFERSDKENQIKISALDKTIASIATSVAKISESQDRLTKGYIEIQQAFTQMAAANEATQRMLRDFTSRQEIHQNNSQSNSVITNDDVTDMDTAVPGKREADDISKSPERKVNTRSASRARASRPISQSGASSPCASFLATSLSDSDLNTSSSSNETQGAGGE